MPSQPSRLFAVLRPPYHCRCGIPKGTKQGCRAWLQRDGMHGCRKLASFGKGGRARLQRRDQFHEPKSNPELFPYHISLYDLWDETNPWPTHQQLTPHPATAKKEVRLSRCHASPLMRADGASLGHLRAQQPGRFFSLPEISIRYIMHLGLPSGEISESDLRRFTPPQSHASSLPPLHHRHHHALALLCLPLWLSSRLAQTLFDAQPRLLPGRIAWGKLTSQLSYLASRCSLPALAMPVVVVTLVGVSDKAMCSAAWPHRL